MKKTGILAFLAASLFAANLALANPLPPPSGGWSSGGATSTGGSGSGSGGNTAIGIGGDGIRYRDRLKQ